MSFLSFDFYLYFLFRRRLKKLNCCTLLFNDLRLERKVTSFSGDLNSEHHVCLCRFINWLLLLNLSNTLVFVLQFRLSEVKGLHHSMSCIALIFVCLFAVQMLVSTK